MDGELQVKQRTNRPPVIVFLIISGVMIAFLSLLVGHMRFPATKIFINIFMPAQPNIFSIIWHIRIPRLVTAAFSGGLIGAAGCIFLALYGAPAFGNKTVKATVGVFALITATIALMISMSYRISGYTMMLMGSLEGRTWHSILFLFPFAVIGVLISILYSRDLNALLFGEYTAKTLGIELPSVKIYLTVIASILALSGAWFCGILSLILLIVPYYVRLYSGENHKYLIPASVFAGAQVMVLADIFSRVIFPSALPIGIVLVLIGGPLYIYALQRRRLGL